MAKGLLFLAVVVVLLLGFGFIATGGELPSSKEKPTMTYTPSTETSCIKNVCNKIIYSTTRFVYEDKIWKPLEQARSLKDKEGIIVKIVTDKDFTLEIVDFNYTKIMFNASTVDKNLNKPIPFKVLDSSKTAKVINEVNITIRNSGGKEQAYYNSLSNESILGKVFKFGTNSTTIIITTADSENLDDTYAQSSSPDTPTGDQIDIRVTDGGTKRSYMKWNLSNIPTGSTIHDALLNLYETAAGQTGKVAVYNITYNGWNEENLTWNYQPCGISFNNTVNCTLIPESYSNITVSSYTTYVTFNITKTLQSSLNTRIMSLALNNYSSGSYIIVFSSKEEEIAFRPFLNVTYTAEVPTIIAYAPINKTYSTSFLNTTLTFTTWDSHGVSSCQYELNGGANVSIPDCRNTSYNSINGNNILKIYSNNTLGYWGVSENVSYTLNLMPCYISSKVASGTDYDFNESGRVEIFATLNNSPLTNGNAIVLINYPDLSVFVDFEELTELNYGRYYYNFHTPYISGIYSYFINFSYGDTNSYDTSTFLVRNKTAIVVSPSYNYSYNYSYNTTLNYTTMLNYSINYSITYNNTYNYSYTFNYTEIYNYTNVYNYTYDYFYNYTLNYTYENNNSFYYNYTFDYFYNYTYDTTLNNTYMYNYTYEYNNTINYTYEYAYTYNYTNDFNYTYTLNYTYDYNYTYINTTDSTYNYSYSYNYSYNYTNNYNDNYTYNDIFNLTYNYTYSYTYNYTNMTAGDLLCTEENSCIATGDMFMRAESITCAGEDACNISLFPNLTKEITTIKEFMYLLSSNDNMKLLSNHDSCLNSTHVIKKLTYSMNDEISEFNETMECPNGCSTSLNTCIPDAMTMNMWMIGIILILTFVVVAGAKLKEIVGLPLLGIGLVVNIYFLMMDLFSNYFKILLAVWVFVFIFTIYWSASLDSRMKKEEDEG